MKRYSKVQAITFDYGQRHRIELKAAKKICDINDIPQKLVPFESFAVLGGNSLLDGGMDIEIPEEGGGLPNTFVPGRNLIFLNLAAAWAYQLKIQNLVTGVCQTDFSGYPDCREATMQALEKSIQLGMEADLKILTPLMHVDKGDSIAMAEELGAMESLAYSHTCYEGKIPPCGQCPSCVLRAKGFEKAGLTDPLLARLDAEG
jgi:7-cyano-7-deazaguanine synthase